MNLTAIALSLVSAFAPIGSSPSVPVSDAPEPTRRIEIGFNGLDVNYTLEDENEQSDRRKYPKRPTKPRKERDVSEEARPSERDTRYLELKEKLDEKYDIMFELKKKLDKVQCGLSEKWEEYYALQRAYNKELQRLISAWATEENYKFTNE